MKRILVTGGLGHIGSRLIRVLPQYIEDAEIVIYKGIARCLICHRKRSIHL